MRVSSRSLRVTMVGLGKGVGSFVGGLEAGKILLQRRSEIYCVGTADCFGQEAQLVQV